MYHNARPLVATQVKTCLEHNGEVIHHPPYSLDFTPSDYKLFSGTSYNLRIRKIGSILDRFDEQKVIIVLPEKNCC